MRACLRTLNGVLNRCIRWTLMGLIRLAFRPKISYVSDRARQEAFRSPMIMVSNHVRGMDGAALCTLFPGKKIHGVSAQGVHGQACSGLVAASPGVCFGGPGSCDRGLAAAVQTHFGQGSGACLHLPGGKMQFSKTDAAL